jgi:hypothetical protein
MATLQLNLQGFNQAFRDAEIDLVNATTGQRLNGLRTYLDGSLVQRDLAPGRWDVTVRHPNLTLPIWQRPIQIFDQGAPTRIPVPVPAELFRDTPIRDVPDADLAPTQLQVQAARDRIASLGGRAPGEAIRAADWNGLVAVVSDLAAAVAEMLVLVAPKGHDHPEIAEKIAEVQENLVRFSEAYGKSLLELRRTVETGSLWNRVRDYATLVGRPEIVEALRPEIDDLTSSVQVDSRIFTRKLGIGDRRQLRRRQDAHPT